MNHSNPGIYVCGTPRGGTSCVAGILHHLGVYMGDTPKNKPHGYLTYEDMQAPKWVRPLGQELGDRTLAFLAGQNSGRDFRGYLEMREKAANGKPWGCKLGVNYPLSDPHPETLPVRWIFVDRPLEVSIRSDAAKTKPKDPVKRAMQIAGYWAGKEWLKRLLMEASTAVIKLPDDFGRVVSQMVAVVDERERFTTEAQFGAALRSIEPDRMHEWAP